MQHFEAFLWAQRGNAAAASSEPWQPSCTGRLFIEQQKDWGNGFPRAYLEIAGTEREEEKKKESVRNVCGKGKSRNKARATRNR